MNLNKRIKRNIKNNVSFYISAFLLTTISVMLLIILATVGYMIKNTVTNIMEINKVEDAQFRTTQIINDGSISQLEQDYNIVLEQMQYIDLDLSDYTIRVFAETQKLNTYDLLEGEQLSSASDILISRDFATAQRIDIGDTIQISDQSFSVSGIAVRPDYLHALKDTSDVGLEKEKFGVAIVSAGFFDGIENSNIYYSIKYNEDNSNIVRKFIASEYDLTSYTNATANRRINHPQGMGDEILSNTVIIIWVMFLLVMAIVAIVLGRMVKNEQKLIGTLSALGYRKRELCLHYVNFALVPAIAGCIVCQLSITGGWISILPVTFTPDPSKYPPAENDSTV